MRFDYVFVGAGLQTALAVIALAEAPVGRRIAVVERAERPLGNHTWCFHRNDLPARAAAWVSPLVARRFPRYRVRFPRYERVIEQPYAMLTVASLAPQFEAALDRLGATRHYGREARIVGPDTVVLDDGSQLSASLVVDARGPDHTLGAAVGYQKFVGYEVRLRRPITGDPVLMDATVPQLDGFRFVYTLPLSEDRALIEDTYYAATPELDVRTIGNRILGYAEKRGLSIDAIERTEQGVLPLAASTTPLHDDPTGPLRAGYRGGWFHPVTGYSFPLAVRLAQHLADVPPERARGPALRTLLTAQRRQARFFVLLNRLLFGALPDAERRNVLERFYRLPAPLIARFYAAELSAWDRARIICGRPPVGFSIRHALRQSSLRLSS